MDFCEFPLKNPRIRKFMDNVSDFLEPISEQDLACSLQLCTGVQKCGHHQKVFKCKKGDNHVLLDSVDDTAIENARMQCMAGSDLYVEPVGGAGHMIVNPTPDTQLAADLFVRGKRRHASRKNHLVGMHMIWILILVQIILLALNYYMV